jgi:hypothetical protein
MSIVASRGALTDVAYRYVRDGIVRGAIPTGTVVAEQAVAAAIGSSRTPSQARALDAFFRRVCSRSAVAGS